MCSIAEILAPLNPIRLPIDSNRVEWSTRPLEESNLDSPVLNTASRNLISHSTSIPTTDMPGPTSTHDSAPAESGSSRTSMTSVTVDPRGSLSNNSIAANSQGTSAGYDSEWSVPEQEHPLDVLPDHLVDSTQAHLSSNVTASGIEPFQTGNTEADAMFLLTVLNLGEVEVVSAADLQKRGPISSSHLIKTINSLLELRLSNESICLGAALLPRACCLRKERAIFPLDSPWYVEAETPLATIAAALRVAQLFLDPEAHNKETFYTAWGFYPYDDLARFARVLGDPETKTPVASVDWDRWCALKRDFERETEGVRGTLDTTLKMHQ